MSEEGDAPIKGGPGLGQVLQLGEFAVVTWETVGKRTLARVREPVYGHFRVAARIKLEGTEYEIQNLERVGKESVVGLWVEPVVEKPKSELEPATPSEAIEKESLLRVKLIEADKPDAVMRQYSLDQLERMARGSKPRGIKRLWVEDGALWAEGAPAVLEKIQNPMDTRDVKGEERDPLIDIARGVGPVLAVEERQKAQNDERIAAEMKRTPQPMDVKKRPS